MRGASPIPTDLESAIADSGAGVVVLVHSETSTGVVADLEPLVAVCNAAGAVSIVDAISSLGAVPLETDAWGVDVVVTGSQKALLTPPGLSFTSVSPRAWERAATATLPRFYFDWRKLRAAQAKGSTAFTPAVSTVAALDEALRILLDQGLEAAFDRHVALGRACRAGVKALGLDLYSPDEDRSAVLTAALTPEGVDAVELRLALRDRHGIVIAGGHGELTRRLFRIGHIGWVSIDDVAAAFDAITEELAAVGVDVEPGVASDSRARRPRHRATRESPRPGTDRRAGRRAAPGALRRGRRHGESNLDDIIDRYDAIVVRSATMLTAELIEKADRLKVIGRAGVGVDNVDVAAATRRGIVVANAPESTVVSAAEQTIGLLVGLARNIPQAHAGLKQGRWERGRWSGVELQGKTLGIVGLRPDRSAGRAAGAGARDAGDRVRPVRR